MSKRTKNDARKRRRQAKTARKAAQRQLYEVRMREGVNTKSKRARLNAKRAKTTRTMRHATGPCGNIGCKRCNPTLLA